MRRVTVLDHVVGVALTASSRGIVPGHGLETVLGAVVIDEGHHVFARGLELEGTRRTFQWLQRPRAGAAGTLAAADEARQNERQH